MKLNETFAELRKKNQAALTGFITVGYPDCGSTIEIANAMIKGGIDILELGLPFSDPLADGKTIQHANDYSIKFGMTPDLFFETAKKITGVPKVCLTYYNLVLQRSVERFTHDCKLSGIAGLIVPDLPLEEADPLRCACKENGVDLILLAAYTTTDERLKQINEASEGFLYVVALMGVTGSRKNVSEKLGPFIQRIRSCGSKLPLLTGFGMSAPEHVRKAVDLGADGVIVGSAFIDLVTINLGDMPRMLGRVEAFAKSLKAETYK